MNSVEALVPFAIPAILAIMVGVEPMTLTALVRGQVAIRLLHLTICLRGGKAAKGENLRTILYVSGAFITLSLVVVTGWTILL